VNSLADADEGRKADTTVENPRAPPVRSIWGISYVKRKMQECASKREQETAADKAARITASATKWMAIFTFILAATSGFTIWILKNQLKEMHEGGIDTHALAQSAELDQRAWLGASDYAYAITESDPVEGSVIVLNTGRTPAMEILCRTTGTTKLKGYILKDSDIVYPADLPTLKEGTIFPNQHFPLKAAGPPMDLSKQKIWFNSVTGGGWIQYFFGDIRYRDVFGRDHWTHFCTQFVPKTKSGTPCSIYNDTDDNKGK
jgi:hypothetical protein